MASKIKICGYCNKPINDAVVVALGKAWHKDHFMCNHCKKPFKNAKYIEEGGQAYCEADWKALFQTPNLPKCAQCNLPIKDTVVNALGKKWHKEHFVCAHCHKPFKDSTFLVEDGKPYCEADHKNLFQNKHGKQASGGNPACAAQASGGKPACAQCNKPIADTVLTALGKHWHKDHFVCAHCKKPITGSEFNSKDGQPYCEKDYTALFRKRCSGCNEMIYDTVLTALDKTWHKQCFSCNKCKKPINAQEGFTEKNGMPLCLTCG